MYSGSILAGAVVLTFMIPSLVFAAEVTPQSRPNLDFSYNLLAFGRRIRKSGFQAMTYPGSEEGRDGNRVSDGAV